MRIPAPFITTLEILLSVWAGVCGAILLVGYIFRGLEYFGFVFYQTIGFVLSGFQVNPIGISITVGLSLFIWRLVKTKKMVYVGVAIGTALVFCVILGILFIITLPMVR